METLQESNELSLFIEVLADMICQYLDTEQAKQMETPVSPKWYLRHLVLPPAA